MKQLDVIRKLEGVYGNRTLRNHSAARGVVRFGQDGGDGVPTSIVLDLSVSKQILLSKSFGSLNYFHTGYERAARSQYAVEVIRQYFERGPTFLEGEGHRATRQAFGILLKEQTDTLGTNAPRIHAAMCKRKHRLRSALDFTRLFVEICLGTMICDLSSLPFRESLKILRARRNVFYYHYHPLRHRDANAALAMLDYPISTFAQSSDGEMKRLVCHALILMAYDPLIATICANLVEGRLMGVATSADTYCPVSFVSRICHEPAEINGFAFERGEVCYVSLVPAANEESNATFPFGAGVHTCIGKKISIEIFRLAELIIAADFSDAFRESPACAPDGAFLSF
ncbi:MAG: hypothetical protein ACI9BW_004191 [Gammaproteobacteria bacterium]|jgi:hypothetical protein